MKTRLLMCVFAMLLIPHDVHGQTSAFSINYNLIRKSVVFIYARRANGTQAPDGTGFLLYAPIKSNPKKGYIILVTARHMVDPSWTGCPQLQLFARFNKKGFNSNASGSSPGTVEYELPSLTEPGSGPKWENWIVPTDESADVAFTVLNGAVLRSLDADFIPIGLNQLAKPNETKLMNTGSQIMSAGLFPGASGNLRNYPVFKFGFISGIPTEKLTLSKDCPAGIARKETAWIIAANLVPGNSGSPVLYVPVAFNGVGFGYGRASVIGVQSSAVVGWGVAGMTPIHFLVDSLKSAGIPDIDLSGLNAEKPKPASNKQPSAH